MRNNTKLITANVTVETETDGFSMDNFEVGGDGLLHSTTYSTLVLKHTTTLEVEVVHLPQGVSSIEYIKDNELNGGVFIKFAEDDVYAEVSVYDKTERNIVLNKLERSARELKL